MQRTEHEHSGFAPQEDDPNPMDCDIQLSYRLYGSAHRSHQYILGVDGRVRNRPYGITVSTLARRVEAERGCAVTPITAIAGALRYPRNMNSLNPQEADNDIRK
jgi:hypothetical protein